MNALHVPYGVHFSRLPFLSASSILLINGIYRHSAPSGPLSHHLDLDLHPDSTKGETPSSVRCCINNGSR
jgi:hypothetical protein